MAGFSAVQEQVSDTWQWCVEAAKAHPVTAAALAVCVGGSMSLLALKHRRYSSLITNGMSEEERKSLTVLITGCDTGFGNALAKKLHSQGLTVVATGLTEMEDLKEMGERMLVYKLDITQNEECESLAQKLKANGITLWGIVNNAGVAYTGPFEAITRERERYEYDVLFHGQLDVTRAMLPLILGRQISDEQIKSETQKKRLNLCGNPKCNGGRIVNVSSVAAELPYPILGRYCTSKSALRWWSHSLRNELSPRFGIWVTPVMPGTFLTPGLSGTLARLKGVMDDVDNQRVDPNIAEIYGMKEYPRLMEQLTQEFTAKANPDLSEVINTLEHALLANHPYHEYQPGWKELSLVAALPLGFKDYLFRLMFAHFP